MASVTLKSPVTHDGTQYVAGDVITDLAQKDVDRLVRLGVATPGETVTIPDGDPETPEASGGITPEQAAEIKKMTKAKLLDALAKAGVEADDSEKAADLKKKLTAAWSNAPADDDEDTGLTPENLAEIAGMEREELIEALEVVGITSTDSKTDEELREMLKNSWADDAAAGG